VVIKLFKRHRDTTIYSALIEGWMENCPNRLLIWYKFTTIYVTNSSSLRNLNNQFIQNYKTTIKPNQTNGQTFWRYLTNPFLEPTSTKQ